MIIKFGWAFLAIALFCMIVQTSAILPFLIGVTLVAYGNWRQASFKRMPTRKLR